MRPAYDALDLRHEPAAPRPERHAPVLEYSESRVLTMVEQEHADGVAVAQPYRPS